MADAASRIEDLKAQIREHNHRYYVLDEPVVSDAQFDSLLRELITLEEEHPDLVTPDSPTQRVGNPVGDQFSALTHLRPMFSLDNAESQEKVEA